MKKRYLLLILLLPFIFGFDARRAMRPDYELPYSTNNRPSIDIDGALGDGTDVRASVRTCTDDDLVVQTLGNNVACYQSKSGVRMILREPEGENLIEHSHELGDVASTSWWGETRLTSVSANGMLAPDGNTVADGLVATAAEDTHLIFIKSPYIGGIIADTKIAITIYAKPGNKNWIRLVLRFYNAGEDNLNDDSAYYFDIANGVVGSKTEDSNGTVHDYMIEEVANGFYRVGIIASTSDATVAKCAAHYRSALADNDDSFAGNALTVNTWFWGADLKIADTFDTTVITSGGTATRESEGGHPYYSAPSGTFTGGSAFTLVAIISPGYDEADATADSAIISGDNAVESLIYFDVSGDGIASHDGSTEVTKALAYTKGTLYKVAVWSDGTDFKVGAEAIGSRFDNDSWGTPDTYDGAFAIANNEFQLAYGIEGLILIGKVKVWNRAITDSEIHAFE